MLKRKTRVPPVLAVFGFIVMVAVPLAFFVFGWRSIDLACGKGARGVSCAVEESFAAGVYVRKISAEGVTGIDYLTSPLRQGTRVTLASTLALETQAGPVKISEVSSNTNDAAKRELILAFRAWLDSGANGEFRCHVAMRDIFGYLGALGTAFWGWILLSWPYYWLRNRRKAAA